MINKNTQKNTNVSTGTKTESSVYLKKSDLSSELVGKSISSFKNDMGYISASSLDAWLKSHSYLSKSEITTLISNANLVVVDSINKEYDEEAIGRLDKQIRELRGEIVAIKNRLSDMEDDFISIDKESNFATKTDVRTLSNKITNIQNGIPSIDGLATEEWVNNQGFLKTHQDLSAYLKKSELPSNLVSKSDLNSYATKTYVNGSLNGYAKKEDVPSIDGLASKSELSDYAKKTELGNYATKNSLNEYAKKTDLSSYAKRTELSNYAKKDDLTNLKNSLSQYATTTEVNNKLGNYVLESTLSSTLKGYVESGTLNNYAKKTDLNSLKNSLSDYAKKDNVYTKDQINSKFLTRTEARDTYTTLEETSEFKKEVARDYLKIEDYRGLKDALVINTDYKEKHLSELIADKDKLVNGFYIVDESTIVVLKDHKIVVNNGTIGDGIAQEEWVLEYFVEKSEIPGLKDELKSWVENKDYATESWVEDQGYLTEHQDISGKADKSELPTKVSDLPNDAGYLTEHQDLSNYVQKSALTWRVI